LPGHGRDPELLHLPEFQAGFCDDVRTHTVMPCLGMVLSIRLRQNAQSQVTVNQRSLIRTEFDGGRKSE
jgi:hypothetical protein